MVSDDYQNYPKKIDRIYSPFMQSMNDFFTQKPIKRLLDTMDEFFDQTHLLQSIPIEMYETDKNLIITADLPGKKREQITVQYSYNQVTISVKHSEKIEQTNDKKQYYYKKQSLNNASRTITLPYPINEKLAKANFKDGQLKITLPKQKRKNINIEE